MKVFKISFCSLLVSLILFNSVYTAYATGAEGVILGGGAELIGLSLTGPQTALVIAGLLGVAYTVDHGEEIYDGMCSAIDTAMDGVEDAAGKISSWWENACSGVIDTTSEVWNGICSWFAGQKENDVAGGAGIVSYSAGDVLTFGRTFVADCDGYLIWYYTIWETDDGNCAAQKGFMLWSSTRFHYITNGNTYSSSYDERTGMWYEGLSSSYSGGTLAYYNGCIPETGYNDCSYCGSDYKEYMRLLLLGNITSIAVPVSVGGINGALESGDLADVQDVVWPDSGIITLNPALQTDVPLSSTMEGVIDGTLTWEDYWERVTTNPLPGVKDVDTGVTYALDNKGVSENEMEISAPLDTSVADNYRMDLTNIFPFCIPFDLYDFLNCLCAEPEAPNFKWTIPLSAVGLEDCTVEINLDKWDSVAQIFRDMELLAFCIGLAFVTRDLIRG